jgi:methionyl-tRNA formyltransferase
MKKKILFFGTPHIAVPSLQAIAANNDYEIVGVGVFSDKPVGRKQILTPCAVKTAALDLNLPIFEVDTKKELKALFSEVECDLAIVIAFGLIFPPSVLTTPPLGVVNVHFSDLPKYRGASPVQAAIINGAEESVITWQRMVSALDAGDILWKTTHNIQNLTTLKVWQDFAEYTAENFTEFLDLYTNDEIMPLPQIEAEATFCGKFEKEDGHLSSKEFTASQIYNYWRAFQPWPGVSLKTQSGLVKLIDISLTASDEASLLLCLDNTELWIKTLQIPGKKPQSALNVLQNQPDLLQSL